jgi:hypothetical protein
VIEVFPKFGRLGSTTAIARGQNTMPMHLTEVPDGIFRLFKTRPFWGAIRFVDVKLYMCTKFGSLGITTAIARAQNILAMVIFRGAGMNFFGF